MMIFPRTKRYGVKKLDAFALFFFTQKFPVIKKTTIFAG